MKNKITDKNVDITDQYKWCNNIGSDSYSFIKSQYILFSTADKCKKWVFNQIVLSNIQEFFFAIFHHFIRCEHFVHGNVFRIKWLLAR